MPGGSWVVTSRVISPKPQTLNHYKHFRGLIIPFITAHEPPSKWRMQGLGAMEDPSLEGGHPGPPNRRVRFLATIHPHPSTGVPLASTEGLRMQSPIYFLTSLGAFAPFSGLNVLPGIAAWTVQQDIPV